ncbi:DNA helicase MCM8 [Fasciola gigantica]|uniref:DNA helicase MCM8 n=1 Tax=Fasciola gigantica TaxID=46835 RepID=A0A504YSN9_FASGI|nr:DNA helicase MCM8 [Fasciola gigantica]
MFGQRTHSRGRRPFPYRSNFRGRRNFSQKRGFSSSDGQSRPYKKTVSSAVSTSSQSESINTDVSTSNFIGTKAQPLVPVDAGCPFSGWILYFPTQPFEVNSKATLYTKAFMHYFTEALQCSGCNSLSNRSAPDTTEETAIDWLRLETQGAALVDYPSLLRSSNLEQKIPELKQIFCDHRDGGALRAQQCELILNCMGMALHTLCYNAVYKQNEKSDFFKVSADTTITTSSRIPPYLAARVVNHSPTTSLHNLRAHHLGQFISVKGIVVRLGPVEPVCYRLTFECCQCATKQILILPMDGRYSTPTRCPASNCRSRSFEPLLNHTDTITIDTQMITIQEASEHESDECTTELGLTSTSVGRSPRCLTCRVNRDLVDTCLPGDVVHVAGCVGLLNPDGLAPGSHTAAASWSHRRGPSMFTLMLNVNSLIRLGSGGAAHPRQSNKQTNGMGKGAGLMIISTVNDGGDPIGRSSDPEQVMSSFDNDFSVKDLHAIREISEQPNLFRLLVTSLCPTICGRGVVKAGLLLALFGGTQVQQRKRTHCQSSGPIEPEFRKSSAPDEHPTLPDQQSQRASPSLSDTGEEVSYRIDAMPATRPTEKNSFDLDFDLDRSEDEEGNAEPVNMNSDGQEESPTCASEFGQNRRSAPHVLIVGDPGLGKSQMLRAAANLAPRVIYVCGNTTTAAGLTVSTIREGSGTGGGFGLEAGALVLADQGCCCIDEFDKLSCDPAVLLEAMEQQTISVARGGMVANLSARASVLAAANPVGGHYDCTRRLDENLRIAPALLSRFDLIYVLLDRPDEAADRLLSEHVTAVHTGTWKPTSFIVSESGSSELNPHGSAGFASEYIEIDPSMPLAERLELRLGERVDFIPHVLLRKYILYARKYVMPVLSVAAASTLRDFYLELRRNRHSRDTFPVTMRQLESLIRLTEARARAELREEATCEDAMDVCELMRATGLGTGHVGETPANATLSQIARMVPQTSRRLTSSSGPAAAKRLLSALDVASVRTNSRLFTRVEIQTLANGLGIASTAVDMLLDRLNDAGAVLKQGKNLYKLV